MVERITEGSEVPGFKNEFKQWGASNGKLFNASTGYSKASFFGAYQAPKAVSFGTVGSNSSSTIQVENQGELEVRVDFRRMHSQRPVSRAAGEIAVGDTTVLKITGETNDVYFQHV